MEISSIIILYCCMVSEMLIFTSRGENMNVQDIIVAIAVALISVAGTLVATRKNQITKNTDAINKLSERLGLNEDKTLRIELSEQYKRIISDMGVKMLDEPSLTKQHKIMHEELKNSYDEIKARYQEEDNMYRKFSREQKELSDTMDNFVRDYKTITARNHELMDEKIKLQEQVQSLQAENRSLKDKIRKLESINRDGRDRR